MKKILLFLFVACSCAYAQNPGIVSGSLEMRWITHESAQILFSTTGSWQFSHVRYVAGTTGCEGVTGGTVYQQGQNFGNEMLKGKHPIPFMGLTPNTVYDACPEVSADGNTWFGGFGISFTTDPLPSVHPQLPIAPTTFNTAYPDTTGFTQVNVASNDDCSSVRNAIKAAIGNSLTTGTVINLPAGSICTGSMILDVYPPDGKVFDNTAFNTTNWHIHIPAHGFSEGDTVQFSVGTQFHFPFQGPSFPGSDQPMLTAIHPFDPGDVVYVHVLDADNIQIYAYAPASAVSGCDSTHPLTHSPCPQLWQFDTPGSGDFRLMKWPRPNHPIIVQSSAVKDGVFLPEHVRVNPNWASKMARIQSPHSFLGGFNKAHELISTQYNDSAESGADWSTTNIRFVGIEITYEPYPQANYSSDPDMARVLILTGSTSSNMIFDRCWIHGYPSPFRIDNAIIWGGKNVAFVDSYMNYLNKSYMWNIGLGVHN